MKVLNDLICGSIEKWLVLKQEQKNVSALTTVLDALSEVVRDLCY